MSPRNARALARVGVRERLLHSNKTKIKTALREGGLFWLTCACASARVRVTAQAPKQKKPDLLKEVGFVRRVRGNANKANILGAILCKKRNVSMVLGGQFSKVPKWVKRNLQTPLHHPFRDSLVSQLLAQLLQAGVRAHPLQILEGFFQGDIRSERG